jgi:phosphatidylglycerol:prolipoprotein diacylglycerol transferase
MLLAFWLIWRLRQHRHAVGWLFGLYLLLGGVERFLVEFLRAKDDRLLGPLTLAQGVSLAIAAVGLVMLARWARRDGSSPADVTALRPDLKAQ